MNGMNGLKTVVISAFVMLVSLSVNAATYTTIADGNWNNSTSVWSLNGTSPCGCAPGSTTSGNDIIIRHDITTTSNIMVNGGSQFVVEGSGKLSGTNNMVVSNGVANFYGNVSLAKFSVDSGGELNVVGSVLSLTNRFSIEGNVLLDGGYVAMSSGNVDVLFGGALITKNGGKVDVYSGNIENEGLVDICETCCMTTQGNWKNRGIVYGSGSATTTGGNMSNTGTWSIDIVWCSNGFDTGMPSPEACDNATTVCSYVMLPVELISFDLEKEGREVVISWSTATESNSDRFVVLKSLNGSSWSVVAEVKAAGNSSELLNYWVVDSEVTQGISYYRLQQIDLDGTFTYSSVKAIEMQGNEQLSFVAPNPAVQGIHNQVVLTNMSGASLVISDAEGRVIVQSSNCEATTVLDITELKKGVYFARIEKMNSTVSTARFVVM